MKSKTILLASFLTLLAGCASDRSSSAGRSHASPAVTVPNGSSPALAHAPRAPMKDTDAMPRGFNHGDGALWVYLPAEGMLAPNGVEEAGALRVKFAWWRGVPGAFSIAGQRLDAPAPPLRSSVQPGAY